jgi:shikimate kinase / 3-dehydroquinate synthase
VAPGLSDGGRAVVFIGFMGAGKTTAARSAAAALGTGALDADDVIEQRVGKSIEEIFSQDGERSFRAAEETIALELLDDPRTTVLALGGGAIASQAVRDALREHPTVWLDVRLETAWARAHGAGRPLAAERATFERLHAEREPLYAELADVIARDGRRARRA